MIRLLLRLSDYPLRRNIRHRRLSRSQSVQIRCKQFSLSHRVKRRMSEYDGLFLLSLLLSRFIVGKATRSG